MTRETRLGKSVALLATGDEISVGDILNTNSQAIAILLTKQRIPVRTHMVVPDTIAEIERAINFLLDQHEALIITGGLGPTSDDLTRYALANVLKEELVFDEFTWDDICKRLKRFGYDNPPQSNRQQALFPTGATILPNINGTAAGCFIIKNNKVIFMLPGPPSECLPMMTTAIETLTQNEFQQNFFHKNWFLFGVSEGQIAEELDGLAKNYACVTGYRLFYPYIEFKLQSQDKTSFETVVEKVEKVIQPFLIEDGSRIASDILREKIISEKFHISFNDQATYGALQAALATPQTLALLKFTDKNDKNFHVEIFGLQEYWERIKDSTHTTITVKIYKDGKEYLKEIRLPFRGSRVIQYAVEYVCREVLTSVLD